MANSKIASAEKERASLSSYTDRDRVYTNVYNNTGLHKSLDFSNIALYRASNDNAIDSLTKNSERNFRRFHQMSLYIQAPFTYSHNKYKALDKSTTLLITSNLPESLSYNLGSKWENPIKFDGGIMNIGMQMLGGAIDKNLSSGISRATTLRVWNGTNPLSLDLTIPVIDDPLDDSKTNLVEALEILGALVLPSYNSDGYGFYLPPPSPLSASIRYGKDKDQVYTFPNPAYSRIMLQLGGILLVDHCIVESLSVEYPNTKTMIKHSYGSTENFGVTGGDYLHPLLAKVKLKISTVEALTANNYSKMLWAREQNSNSGSASLDVSGIAESIKNLRGK